MASPAVGSAVGRSGVPLLYLPHLVRHAPTFAPRCSVSVRPRLNRQPLLRTFASAPALPSLSAAQNQAGPSRSTVDEAEVRKFSALADSWWQDDGRGPFAPLHSLNALRVPLVRQALLGGADASSSSARPPAAAAGGRPLEGFTVLDVGCGGGIFSEGLARVGARVTGIDASSANVRAASHHAQHDPWLAGRVTYEATTVEAVAARLLRGPHPSPSSSTQFSPVLSSSTAALQPSPSPSSQSHGGAEADGACASALSSDGSAPAGAPCQFDAVVASEVLEHVADVGAFLDACTALVKVRVSRGAFLDACTALVEPGGVFVATTLNRTAASLLLAILGGEYVLRLVPPGTHEWAKFIPPQHLASQLVGRGMTVTAQTGMRYNPLTAAWSWARDDLSVNYAMVAAKPRRPESSLRR